MLPFEGGKNYIPAGGVSWRGAEWGCCTTFCLAQVCLESEAGPGTVLALNPGNVAVKEASSLRPTTSFSKDGLS